MKKAARRGGGKEKEMSICANYTMEHARLMVRARKMALRCFSNYPQEIDEEATKKYSRLVVGLAGLLARRFINSIQQRFFFLPRAFRTRHRQPVRRSAAKAKGDDGGGGDGDPDGEPEPPLTTRLFRSLRREKSLLENIRSEIDTLLSRGGCSA